MTRKSNARLTRGNKPKLSDAQSKQLMFDAVTKTLEQLAVLFVPEVKITFISRIPGNDESDVLITGDTIDELKKLLNRSAKREMEPVVPSGEIKNDLVSVHPDSN